MNLKKIIGLVVISSLVLGCASNMLGSDKQLISAMNKYTNDGDDTELKSLIEKNSTLATKGLKAAANKYSKLSSSASSTNADQLEQTQDLILFFVKKGGDVDTIRNTSAYNTLSQEISEAKPTKKSSWRFW